MSLNRNGIVENQLNGISITGTGLPDYTKIIEVQPEPEIQAISGNTVDTLENVNGIKFDPFARIEIQQLINDDGFQSQARNVKVYNNDGKGVEAGVVGQNYLLIKNQEVHDKCSEIRLESGMEWEHDKIFFDGKRYRNVYKTQSLARTLDTGDVAFLMFTELNSYDGSTTAGFRVDFMILVCQNGMISPRYGWDSRFRHSLQNVNWQNEIKAGALALTGNLAQTRLDRFAENCNALQNPLGMDNLSEIRKVYIDKLPNLRYGEILTEYHKKEGSTMWDLMQAGTSTLWHRDKMTNADFVNNGNFVDGLLKYGDACYSKAGISQ